MRTFLLALFTLVVAVSAAQLEQRSPFHAISSSLVARADVIDPSIIPDQCKNACSAMVSDLNGCTGLDCLCTNENGKQLKQCVDCLVKVTPSDTTTANGQATLDGFVAGCKAGGKSINSLTLGGSSNSNSNSNSSFGSSNGARGSTLHLVANSGALAVALVGVVAYLF